MASTKPLTQQQLSFAQAVEIFESLQHLGQTATKLGLFSPTDDAAFVAIKKRTLNKISRNYPAFTFEYAEYAKTLSSIGRGKDQPSKA